MARTVKDQRIDTRTARRDIPHTREPVWRLIGRGAHIGYRRHQNGGGSWIARMRLENGKYAHEQIGVADDIEDADGVRVFNFSQAQEKARQLFSRTAHEQAGEHFGPYTVKDAVEAYMATYRISGKGIKNAQCIIDAYILPEFGHCLVSKLTTNQIRDWLERCAASSSRKRVKKGEEPTYQPKDNSAEGRRKRKATVNRYLNIFKAILNKAFIDGKAPSDHAWRRVKPFRNVDLPRVGYFDLDDITRLINVCPPDLRSLVCAALYTGCRYSEIASLTAKDYLRDIGKLYIKPSKNGKHRHVTLSAEGIDFFHTLALGKKPDDLLLTRKDGSQWGKSYQQRPFREALKNARITKNVNFHSLRHTHASLLAMNKVDMIVIASQLGHSDTRMAERHYAHLNESYISDKIREGMPSFGINQKSNVEPLSQRAFK